MGVGASATPPEPLESALKVAPPLGFLQVSRICSVYLGTPWELSGNFMGTPWELSGNSAIFEGGILLR